MSTFKLFSRYEQVRRSMRRQGLDPISFVQEWKGTHRVLIPTLYNLTRHRFGLQAQDQNKLI